jgi:hypothetical protein
MDKAIQSKAAAPHQMLLGQGWRVMAWEGVGWCRWCTSVISCATTAISSINLAKDTKATPRLTDSAKKHKLYKRKRASLPNQGLIPVCPFAPV